MRWVALSSLILCLTSPLPISADPSFSGGSGGLYPPGLVPLINRANVLLSSGQFNEAVRLYSEAIEQSPLDYLLYYKRATAYFSLSRHAQALDDFEKVLKLTGGTFDHAHLMKARIWTKDGNFESARSELGTYKKAVKGKGTNVEDVVELEKDLEQGEGLKEKMERERRAQLWTACVESASGALRVASHSVDIRSVRAECALAAGDVESAVGDLTRLSNLLPPSTTLLTTVFRLSYFLLPPSPSSLSALKQCLHYDPDSKPCLALHRLHKSFDKAFENLAKLESEENWAGVVNLLLGTPSGSSSSRGVPKSDFLHKFEETMKEHTTRENLLPPQLSQRSDAPEIPLPDPMKKSHQRQTLVRAICKASTKIATSSGGVGTSRRIKEMEKWCSELLTLEGCEEDVDGLVGKGESLIAKEEWEEGVRFLEKAFEKSGRSNREIHQRLQKAQKLLKQSRQKDYYKILGVARDADDRTIKKAFRRAAKTAHPDKGGSEAKMAAINEAYEVLINPELRQRFDNGEDPNDPMSSQNGPFTYGYPFPGGQHPFAQFFQGGFPGGSFGGAGGGGGQRFQQSGGGFPGGGFQFQFTHG